MLKVSDRLAGLSTSPTFAMSQKSKELCKQGVDIIDLSVGEPDFNTPDHIKEAGKKAITDNYSHYSPIPGFSELLEAITLKLKNDNGLHFTPSQIVVSNGAKQSLANVILSVVNKGDEVIVPSPYWVSYIELVKLAEAKNVFIRASIDQEFKITPKQLEAAISPKTRAFLFSSPSNPTGSIYTRDELKALAEVFSRYPQIIIISDEIYEYINYIGQHESIAQFEAIHNRVVVVNGVSKGYAMTGWRIGYIAAPEWIAKACSKLQGQMTSGASSIAQMASVAALTGDQTCIRTMCEAFRQRRDKALAEMRNIAGFRVREPKGAFYLFPDVSDFFGRKNGSYVINNATDLSLYLLEHAHVATVTGEAFGEPDCIRISYAASEEKIAEALHRIKMAVEELV